MAEEQFNPFYSEEVAAPHSEHWEAKRRVADAIRELTEVLATSVPPSEDLHAIAERLESTADNFSRYQRIYGRFAFSEEGSHGNQGEVFHELNPVAGLSNPLAPPLNTWLKDDRAYGKVTAGWAYEGPPGCLHGGFVAAIFDDFMGTAQLLGKQPGMTGTLSIRYNRPTPLNTELDLTAWLESVDGRKTRIRAELYAGEIMTASCEGLFIRPRDTMEKLSEAVRQRNVDVRADGRGPGAEEGSR